MLMLLKLLLPLYMSRYIVFLNMQGRTALHHAAFHNQSETVKALLCCGADATARDNQV